MIDNWWDDLGEDLLIYDVFDYIHTTVVEVDEMREREIGKRSEQKVMDLIVWGVMVVDEVFHECEHQLAWIQFWCVGGQKEICNPMLRQEGKKMALSVCAEVNRSVVCDEVVPPFQISIIDCHTNE